MKNAWLVYREPDAKKNKHYIRMYFDEGVRWGISFRLLYREKITIGVDRNRNILYYEEEEIKAPHFVIQRSVDLLLTKQLEKMGIPVFNNSTVSAICNNKAFTYQHVSALGVSCIPSTFHKNAELQDIRIKRNQIIKAVDGHGGTQVFSGETEMSVIREGIGNSDFVIQEKITGGGKDIRVYVIGKEIIAAVCRQAESGFRANYSLGGTVSLYKMNHNQVRMVEKIIRHFPAAMVGIDFLTDRNGEWLLNEMEDVVGARMLYECSDINLVEHYLLYIKNNLEEKENICQ